MPNTLALGDDACMQTVGRLAEQMLAVIDKDQSMQIDITAAVNADLSIIQLIEAARRHGALVGCDLSLVGALPPSMRDVLDRAGVLTAATPAEIAFWHHGDNDQ